MIKTLTIKNFQSHKNTELEFVPGVNVIIGASDSGKTAIIRALRWLIWNKPSGDAFCSHWGGNTHVSIITDKYGIARNKGEVNSYALRENDDDEVSEFKAFGMNVPEEIQKAINLDEVNLQSQLDAPFLLTESPGQVAAHFNKIAGIDVIDNSLKAAKKEINQTTTILEQQRKDLKEKKEECAKYEKIEHFEIQLEVLEQHEKEKIVVANKIRKINSLIESYKNVCNIIEENAELLSYKTKVDDLLSLFEKKNNVYSSMKKIHSLIGDYRYIKEHVVRNNTKIKFETVVNDLLLNYAELKQKKAVSATLTKLLSNYITLKNQAENALKQAKKLHKLFDENMPDICPLCNSKIK